MIDRAPDFDVAQTAQDELISVIIIDQRVMRYNDPATGHDRFIGVPLDVGDVREQLPISDPYDRRRHCRYAFEVDRAKLSSFLHHAFRHLDRTHETHTQKTLAECALADDDIDFQPLMRDSETFHSHPGGQHLPSVLLCERLPNVRDDVIVLTVNAEKDIAVEPRRKTLNSAIVFAQNLLFSVLNLVLPDHIASHETSVALFDNSDFVERRDLSQNHFDVLVVDADTLRVIDVLDLVYQHSLNRVNPADLQELLRVDAALRECRELVNFESDLDALLDFLT